MSNFKFLFGGLAICALTPTVWAEQPHNEFDSTLNGFYICADWFRSGGETPSDLRGYKIATEAERNKYNANSSVLLGRPGNRISRVGTSYKEIGPEIIKLKVPYSTVFIDEYSEEKDTEQSVAFISSEGCTFKTTRSEGKESVGLRHDLFFDDKNLSDIKDFAQSFFVTKPDFKHPKLFSGRSAVSKARRHELAGFMIALEYENLTGIAVYATTHTRSKSPQTVFHIVRRLEQ